MQAFVYNSIDCGLPVDEIPQDGEVFACKVDSDLVHSAAIELYPNEGNLTELVMLECFFTSAFSF